MQTMREKWTDERLDDLSAKVDRGFERVDSDIRELRGEMNARFDAMDRRLDAMNRTIEGLTRTMLWFAGALLIAIVASNLAS